MKSKSVHYFACAILVGVAVAKAAVLPRGMGIGTPDDLKTAKQTRVDLAFLHISLDDTGIDAATKAKVEKALDATEAAAKTLEFEKAYRSANQKFREFLTADQKKKYDLWMLEQIKKLGPAQNAPTTKP